MAIEIELKAWVDDPEALQSRLSCLVESAGSFVKEDVYWFPPEEGTSPPQGPPRGLPKGLGSGGPPGPPRGARSPINA